MIDLTGTSPYDKPRTIRPQDWPESQTQKLIDYRANGFSFGEIAQLMGVTRSAIAGKLRRLSGK